MIKMYPNPVNPKIKKILIQTNNDIVKAHGGELKVITKEREGGTFIIQIPIT